MISPLKAALVVASMTLITACAHQQKHTQAAPPPPPPTPQQSATTQIKTDLTAEKDSFVQRTEARLQELEQQTVSLRTKSVDLQKPQSKKVANAADDLEGYLKEVRTHLDEVKSAAPENWVDYRRDVQASMNRAESQYSNALALLR